MRKDCEIFLPSKANYFLILSWFLFAVGFAFLIESWNFHVPSKHGFRSFCYFMPGDLLGAIIANFWFYKRPQLKTEQALFDRLHEVDGLLLISAPKSNPWHWLDWVSLCALHWPSELLNSDRFINRLLQIKDIILCLNQQYIDEKSPWQAKGEPVLVM